MSQIKVSDLPVKSTLESSDRVLSYNSGGTSLLLGSLFLAIQTASEAARDGSVAAKNAAVDAQNGAVNAKNSAQSTVTGFDAHVAAQMEIASAEVMSRIAALITDRSAQTLSATLPAGTAYTVPRHKVGGNNLMVFVNGSVAVPGVDYVDASATTITFTSTLSAGARIYAIAVAQDPSQSLARITDAQIDGLF